MAASGVTVFEQNKEQLPQPKPPKDKVLLDERGLLDLPFLALTVLLVLIGVIMMFSASYARAYQETGKSTYYFARQAVFAVLGIAGMLFVSRLNYQMWRFASFIVLGVSVFFLLLVPFIGEASHGAKRWITVAGIRFQPSELAKVAIVMSFASLMSIYREKMQTFKYGILPFALILVVICGLVALERHFSCILIMLALGAVMMFLGGVRLRWFIIGGVAGGAPAAARLRRLDENAEIVLLERSGYISYANCGLPYYVGGVIQDREALTLQTPERFRARFNIDVRVRHEAVALHPERRTVTVRRLEDGSEYEESYDKLLLSPGAKAVRPPLPGAEDPRAFTLALEKLGEKAEACTLFEDSPGVCRTAKGLGLTVVGVYDPFYALYEAEMPSFCHRYIRSFAELL